MNAITKKSIEDDLKIIEQLCAKYKNAIWEGQNAQPAHYDRQLKLVKIAMVDVRTGLSLAESALTTLNECDIIED